MAGAMDSERLTVNFHLPYFIDIELGFQLRYSHKADSINIAALMAQAAPPDRDPHHATTRLISRREQKTAPGLPIISSHDTAFNGANEGKV